jgi:hypothetical protein
MTVGCAGSSRAVRACCAAAAFAAEGIAGRRVRSGRKNAAVARMNAVSTAAAAARPRRNLAAKIRRR